MKQDYKVTQICISHYGGAGIAAVRLNNALKQSGIDSNFLCLYKKNYDPAIVQYQPSLMSRLAQRLPLPIKQNKYNKLTGDYEVMSFPEAFFDISNHPLVQNADIINLHWIGRMLNYPAFFKNVKKPIVWTLHDMNPFLGLAHYQGDVKANPQNAEIESRIRRFKEKAYASHDSISIVNLCNWMQEYSSQSDAFSHRKHVIIPNSLDINIFKPYDKLLVRRVLEIPEAKPVLMFCCESLKNKRKGFDILLDAIRVIDQECTIVTVGASGDLKKNIPSKITLKEFGTVSDARLLAMIYAAADLFVLPSREDNLPNTMLESLCAGTPVISFDNGGMRDVIVNNENGILLNDHTSHALGNAINELLPNLDKFSTSEISRRAHKIFNPTTQANQYDELYRSLLR